MNYTISRDGQTLGTRSQDELPSLLQSGELRPTDLAQAEGSAGPRALATLVDLSTRPCLPPPLPTYLVRRGPDQFGPYSFQELQAHALGGRVVPTDMVWSHGMTAWEPVDVMLKRHGAQLPANFDRGADEAMTWVTPVGRSGLAIAAGYLGLFSLLGFPAPIALVVGVLALRDLKKHPAKLGAGRAWFGTIAGGLGTLILISIFILAALENSLRPQP